ncbi:MAG: transporter substrate-binding protein [Paenibacillaceae bacterium]|nr:transporter substrate-binding protein [Paenibacillaceae bacterium]
MWKRSSAILLSVALSATMLAACAQKTGADDKTQHVLRISSSTGYNESSFRQQFTEVFEFANPNIEIEYIPTMDETRYYVPRQAGEKQPNPYETLKEIMQGDNPPDVVMISYDQLPDLIANNMLIQLVPLVTKDKFDVSDLVPAVIDGLKTIGDNKLYALAPTFSSSAIVYNKTLFDQAGVGYPQDGMTWEQIFDLAHRVTKPDDENPVYGFGFSTGYSDVYNGIPVFTAPLQLTMYNDNADKMTVDSDQWEKVWKTMLQLVTDKVIPPRPENGKRPMPMANGKFNPFQYDDFLSGRLAMAVINYSQITQIVNANKSAGQIEGFKPINWDVVTMPSHPEAPGIGGNIYMNGIMAINAKAQNQADAWNFIKFINGEDWAKLRSHNDYEMVSRKKYIQPIDGLDFHIQAFYNIIPAPMQNNAALRDNPNLYRVQDIGRQMFQSVENGELEVRDALKQWQTQGDSLLQQIKNNPNGPIDMSGVRKATSVQVR